MPERPRRSALSAVISRSPRKISPLVGFNSPDSRLTSVVLPAPFGPITAWISPMASSSDTSFTATRPPKRLVNPAVRSAISDMTMRRQNAIDERLHAARKRQYDCDDDQSLGELPVLGDTFEPLLQAHHDDGADQRRRDTALTAEHHHHQRNRRLVPAKHLRRDVSKLRGGEVAGKPRERTGDHEGAQAQAIDRKTERAGAPLIIARGCQRAAEWRAGQRIK